MSTFLKDPDAVLNYTVNWASEDGTNDGTSSDTGWLQGDTIATAVWVVPAGITEDASSNTTKAATIKLSGGMVGKIYTIVNRVTTTTSSETDDRSITIQCVER